MPLSLPVTTATLPSSDIRSSSVPFLDRPGLPLQNADVVHGSGARVGATIVVPGAARARYGRSRILRPGPRWNGSSPKNGGIPIHSSAARDLAFAPRDEGIEGLDDGRVERGRRRLCEESLPDRVRAFSRGPRSVRLPRLEVPPVRYEWLIERGLVALERVRCPEEVAAGAHIGDGVEAEGGLVHDERLEDLGHHLE